MSSRMVMYAALIEIYKLHLFNMFTLKAFADRQKLNTLPPEHIRNQDCHTTMALLFKNNDMFEKLFYKNNSSLNTFETV